MTPILLAIEATDEAAVRTALAALWPEASVLVVVGEAPPDGLSFAGGALTRTIGGAVVEEASGLDPASAVLVARSWLASSAVLDDVAPDIPFVVVDLGSDPLTPPSRQRPAATRAWAGVGADLGLGGVPHAGRVAAGWVGDPVELVVSLAIGVEGASAAAGNPGETAVRAAAIGVAGVWDLGLERRVAGRPTVAPWVSLGLEAGPTLDRVASARGVDVAPVRPGGSVVGAAGVDAWAGQAGALRATLAGRTTVAGIDAWVGVGFVVCARAKDPAAP